MVFVAPSLNFYSGSAGDNKVYFNFGNGSFGTTQLTGTTYQDSNGQGCSNINHQQTT